MSRSPDDGLRAELHSHLRAGWHWQAVETGGTGLGIPDSNFCGPGGAEGWVECKATEAWSLSLRTEQVGWLCRRAHVGGRVWIATRRRHDGGVIRGAAVDELWLHWGGWARELEAGGLRAVEPAGVWSGGPSGWDWSGVAEVLVSRG